MRTATRRSLQVDERPRALISSNGNGHARLNGNAHVRPNGNGHSNGANGNHSNGDGARANGATQNACSADSAQRSGPKPRVFVAAENRLLREALSRMLTKNGDIEVVGGDAAEPLPAFLQNCAPNTPRRDDLGAPTGPSMSLALLAEDADILLLSSKGNLEQDMAAIRKIRSTQPEVLILLIDVTGDEINFLQCVRAGVRGYLPRDASADEVVEAVCALHAGKAVCPGTLCTVLFRYVEREATCFPSASLHQRLGLTRREQQLIPLVAEGLTNKEIANHFCLSEQTVKNHLYRMKQKVGADDRLGIVQMCRTQGFLV